MQGQHYASRPGFVKDEFRESRGSGGEAVAYDVGVFDGFSVLDLSSLSGWTVLALLLAFGWLVPKRTVDREQKLLQREADGWRAAHDTEREQLGLILEQLRTPPRVLPPGGYRPPNGRDAVSEPVT